jgi:hypothetical protein
LTGHFIFWTFVSFFFIFVWFRTLFWNIQHSTQPVNIHKSTDCCVWKWTKWMWFLSFSTFSSLRFSFLLFSFFVNCSKSCKFWSNFGLNWLRTTFPTFAKTSLQHNNITQSLSKQVHEKIRISD